MILNLQRLYLYKIKPNLTLDPAMPSFVRDAVHDLADEIWQSIYSELCLYLASAEEPSAAPHQPPASPPPPSPPVSPPPALPSNPEKLSPPPHLPAGEMPSSPPHSLTLPSPLPKARSPAAGPAEQSLAEPLLLGHSALVALADPPLLQGFLMKQSGGHRVYSKPDQWGGWASSWWGNVVGKEQRRWFVLHAGTGGGGGGGSADDCGSSASSSSAVPSLAWYEPDDAYALLQLPPPPKSHHVAACSDDEDERRVHAKPPTPLNRMVCTGAIIEEVEGGNDVAASDDVAAGGSLEFRVVTPDRILYLRADSAEEAQQWISALRSMQPHSAGGEGGFSRFWRCVPLAGEMLSGVRAAAGFALRARARLLYLYLPFDKSIYGQLRSPTSVVLLIIASWPESLTPLMRPCFFTLILGCILREQHPFQLRNFILQLKGTQFLSAILVLFSGFAQLYYCTALTYEFSCAAYGPGVHVDIFQSM